jgi:hypothetical protein
MVHEDSLYGSQLQMNVLESSFPPDFPGLRRVRVRIRQLIGARRVFGRRLYKTLLQKGPSRGITELLSWLARNLIDGLRPVGKVEEDYYAGKCRYHILIGSESHLSTPSGYQMLNCL